MALVAPKNNEYKARNFELVPSGNHVASLYQILHIGTVEDTFEGDTRWVDKIRFTFELSNERKEFKEGEGEKPFSISKEMTFSMNEKAHLRKIVEGMLGVALSEEEAEAFEIDAVLGKSCLLNVVHKTTKRGMNIAVILTASPLPKGMPKPENFNEPRLLDVNTISDEDMGKLPGFLREKMESSKEWKKRNNIEESNAADTITAGDLPF